MYFLPFIVYVFIEQTYKHVHDTFNMNKGHGINFSEFSGSNIVNCISPSYSS